jgi:hypothetical protein
MLIEFGNGFHRLLAEMALDVRAVPHDTIAKHNRLPKHLDGRNLQLINQLPQRIWPELGIIVELCRASLVEHRSGVKPSRHDFPADFAARFE